MNLFNNLFKKKNNGYIYTKNVVFVAIKRQYAFVEDDIDYLFKVLKGKVNNTFSVPFKFRGVRSYNDVEILITLSEIDKQLLSDRIESYDGLRIV